MKHRTIWKMFALTILTIGIYRLYWFVKTRKEMMKLNPKVKIMSPVYFFAPLLIVITSFVAFIISDFSTPEKPAYCSTYVETANGYRGFPKTKECSLDSSFWPGIIFFLSFVFIWPLIFIWLWSYAKAVELITKGKTSFAMSLLVLLAVPDGIDILIIQDGFNKLSPAKA